MKTMQFEMDAPDAVQLLRDTLLLNVETTGLRSSSSFVCMVSAAYPVENRLVCRTWLAGSRRDEAVLLEEVQKTAAPFPAICTYGGNGFAFRFLRDRQAIYRDDPLFGDSLLIDLQKAFRPLLQILPLTSLKKEDLERFLRFRREGILTGRELVWVYQTWEREHTPDPAKALFLHAREDIRFLSEACRLNAYLDFLHGKWDSLCWEESPEGILFHADLCAPIPAKVSWSSDYGRFTLAGRQAHILVTPFSGRLRYYLPGSCSDYFYLPAEDTAIHRSLAQFVDRTQRQKATPETCYVNRDGIFLPVPGSFPPPVFHKSYRETPAYTQYDKEKWQLDTSLAEQYLAAIL